MKQNQIDLNMYQISINMIINGNKKKCRFRDRIL